MQEADEARALLQLGADRLRTTGKFLELAANRLDQSASDHSIDDPDIARDMLSALAGKAGSYMMDTLFTLTRIER